MNKLSQMTLPRYTEGEERANTLSHLAGFIFALFSLYTATYRSLNLDKPHVTAGCLIYGISMAAVYAVSSVYHALNPGRLKKLMRIADHCVIYLLIAGTYTPILLAAVMPVSPVTATALLVFVWVCAAVGIL
ncbi:MAG: hemolysin III family protein, partial [Clostridia bacterium]|nr:hemolysin III family protein [Clostridia bacterium]